MVNALSTPLTGEVIEGLHAGDRVHINGTLFVARDAAHQRFLQALSRGEELPFDIAGQIIYYMGPTPARPGHVIGSAGPTSSYRMDAYTPPLLELGLKGMIGKGPRGRDFYEQPDGELLHLTNWVECVRSRNRPTAPAEAGVSAASAAHLGNQALRKDQVAVWPKG